MIFLKLFFRLFRTDSDRYIAFGIKNSGNEDKQGKLTLSVFQK